MIQLFHSMSARSFRPLWMLEELGQPYELIMLPFPPRTLSRSYLAINPLGTIPFLIDGQTRMSESAAICQYLCTKYAPTQLEVSANEQGFGQYLNYLHFGEATLTFPQTLILRYAHFEPLARRQAGVAEDYAKWFLSRLKNLEQELTKNSYLCENRFTAADVSVGYALMLAGYLGLSSKFAPAVAIYWQRLQDREGFKNALKAQHQAALAQGVSTRHAPDISISELEK